MRTSPKSKAPEEPIMDYILKNRGKIFSRNYLPIYVDMNRFQDHEFKKIIHEIKGKI